MPSTRTGELSFALSTLEEGVLNTFCKCTEITLCLFLSFATFWRDTRSPSLPTTRKGSRAFDLDQSDLTNTSSPI